MNCWPSGEGSVGCPPVSSPELVANAICSSWLEVLAPEEHDLVLEQSRPYGGDRDRRQLG